MHRLRKLTFIAAMAGGSLWSGEAHATITPTPDDAKCTYTNDNISICTLKDGSQMCKDRYGMDIDCPKTKERPQAGVIGPA